MRHSLVVLAALWYSLLRNRLSPLAGRTPDGHPDEGWPRDAGHRLQGFQADWQ
jgi:hypothetical protein